MPVIVTSEFLALIEIIAVNASEQFVKSGKNFQTILSTQKLTQLLNLATKVLNQYLNNSCKFIHL